MSTEVQPVKLSRKQKKAAIMAGRTVRPTNEKQKIVVLLVLLVVVESAMSLIVLSSCLIKVGLQTGGRAVVFDELYDLPVFWYKSG